MSLAITTSTAAAAAMPLRVRQILSAMDLQTRNNLKKLLPKGLTMPDEESTGRYPNALLSILNHEEQYALLGCIAEEMLGYPVSDITLATLEAIALKWQPDLTPTAIAKLKTSVTTEPFLTHLRITRAKVDAVVRGPLQGETAVQYQCVQGHPDARTPTQLFEIKLTGMLKKNWQAFLFQTFAYAALEPAATDIYIVLPLQDTVWHHNVQTWTNRTQYRDALVAAATKLQQNSAMDIITGALIRQTFRIGTHIQKMKVLKQTFEGIQDPALPYQVFLGAPTNTKLTIPDSELAAASSSIASRKLTMYVHSQYLINMCAAPEGETVWGADLLSRNLGYANTLGCKGVVVHVGKSTSKPLPEALENMRKTINRVIRYATSTCPLLLETPAGQGSEMLTDRQAFIDFVASFADPRLRICVDTCHVFACGHNPLDYINQVESTDKDLLKLIHYNDSAAPCGSCVDRHAFMGSGHIGMDDMKAIAERCGALNLPMVIE
jgi:deoxyribonuclease-4